MFASAAMAQQSSVNETTRANEGTVGIIAGMEGGTYTRTAADLTILDNDTLRVLPTLGRGSLQNLSDILFLKGIDIGFVQADALTYAKQHNMFPGLTQNIRYIAKLFYDEVHILARKDINRIEDLNGQSVNVDVNGSGSAMTADILLSALGIKANIAHAKQVDGLQALTHGDIAEFLLMRQQFARLVDNCKVSVEFGVRFAGRLRCGIVLRCNVGHRIPLRFAVHS